MSEQLVETTFCGFTAREVLAMESRIDDFKKQLAIAVDALKFYDKCDHFINKPDGKVELVDHGCKANEALTRIKQL